MKVLGLDISTTSTGWAILEGDSSPSLTLVDSGKLTFPNDKPHKERLVIFQELITHLVNQSSNVLDFVIIEDTFVKFDPSVTKKLSRFAGVAISAITTTQPNTVIALISPQSIKSVIFPRQKKEKEDIKIEILKRFNLVQFDATLPKETILKLPEVKNYCDDITDAIAIAHFPFFRKVEDKWIV